MNKITRQAIAKVRSQEALTEKEKKAMIEYSICTNHTGKMAGMVSISTSCLLNPSCQARRKMAEDGIFPFDCICLECYAHAQLEYQSTTAKKLETNTKFYNTYDLSLADIPLINCGYFREEAFGDLGSPQHAKNFLTLLKANKSTIAHPAIWTKNPGILQAACDIWGKPKNLVCVYSNLAIDDPMTAEDLAELQKRYPCIDKVFNVVTEEYAKKHNIKINCGARHCLSCRICYHHSTRAENNVIYEILK